MPRILIISAVLIPITLLGCVRILKWSTNISSHTWNLGQSLWEQPPSENSLLNYYVCDLTYWCIVVTKQRYKYVDLRSADMSVALTLCSVAFFHFHPFPGPWIADSMNTVCKHSFDAFTDGWRGMTFLKACHSSHADRTFSNVAVWEWSAKRSQFRSIDTSWHG